MEYFESLFTLVRRITEIVDAGKFQTTRTLEMLATR